MRKQNLLFICCAAVFLTSVFVLQSSGRSASAIPPEVQAAMIGGSGVSCGTPACVRDADWDCKNYVDCSGGCPAGQVRCTDPTQTHACVGEWFVPSCWPWAGKCWPGYVMTGECVGNVCVVQGDAGYCPGRYWSNCI